MQCRHVHPHPSSRWRTSQSKLLNHDNLAEADEQTEIEVILEESGGDEDRKRYKVTLTPANKIDMNAIVEYCQGAKQSEKAKDMSV
jgi:hypothetical protein